MARYAAKGAGVTLVTCTLGEEGEIHVPELARLASTDADQLGGYRLRELDAACAALGVVDHRVLGGAGRYRDSGMMGTAANTHARAFWQADVDEAAGHLVEIMREVRPQVLISDDPNGTYGHPDHIQSHRVAMRAAELAAAEGVGPTKIYWTAIPESAVLAGIEEFGRLAHDLAADTAGSGGPSGGLFGDVDDPADLPFLVPDNKVTARIDGTAFRKARTNALLAHATQIPPTSPLLIASSMGLTFLSVDHYTLVAGEKGPGHGPNDWEDDLFAGIVPDPATW
jgi:N-acetyl-1-D-myo-inositol-2-amino-2-deoxy-alpha-D-glucopyranoside deacetylase